MISDETAYRRIFHGDQKSADILVERYGDSLTLYLNGYTKDLFDAEDLMIESFSLIFAKERPLQVKGSFKAYLYRIGRNLAIRRYKKKMHHVLVSFDELPYELQSDALVDTNLIKNERGRYLYDAMRQLKTEYREAVYLVYFENLSYKEAGQVMGKTEPQITNLVFRGKQRLKVLKVLLEKAGYDYADE